MRFLNKVKEILKAELKGLQAGVKAEIERNQGLDCFMIFASPF